ncbi:MAG TPA: hypothetical protein VKD67_09300, partial [Acidimicrobiales bacterium]|nr:hypothetical protein [Acidimicrobiales bacterium]
AGRRGSARLAGAVLVTAVVAAGLVVGGATVASAAAEPPRLTLVSQDLVVAPGGTASFTFTVTGTVPDGAEIVIEAYGRLQSPRADLHKLVAGQTRYRDVGFVATSLSRLTPDGPGRYTVPLPTVTSADQRVVGGNALLPDQGMYPVTVELRADNVPLAQIVTSIVRADAAGTNPAPFDVALVVPLDGAVTLQPDGSTVIATADRTRLQAVTGALAAVATPVTVVPRPELVDGLARSGLPGDAELRAALGTAIAGRQVLATPYVAIDPTAAVRSGLGDELTKQLTEGEDVLGAVDGSGADRSTWVLTAKTGDDAVGLLRDLGVRRLVLPPDALTADPAAPGTPTTGISVADGTSTLGVEAAVADPELAAAFDHHDDPVLAAYHFVEELLAVGLEHAADPAHQGVVVVPPAGWQPEPAFLTTLLSLLSQNPMLRPVTLDQWFRDVTPVRTPPRHLAVATPVDLAGHADGLALTRIRLGALASMLPAADALPASLESELRVSNATTLTDARRQAYLDSVNSQLDTLGDAVDPVPRRRVTLTGRTTELPITLHRRIDRPIQVRLHLESPKLSFPENDLLVTLDSDTVQQRVAVQARSNGTFPLTVQVVTPSGGIPVAPSTELTVQATTLSGFGVALSAGALLVLATWWVRHIRKGRRQRGVEAGARHHPSARPSPGTLPAP